MKRETDDNFYGYFVLVVLFSIVVFFYFVIDETILTVFSVIIFLLFFMWEINNRNRRKKEKKKNDEIREKIKSFFSDERTGKLSYTHKEHYIGVSVDYDYDFNKQNGLSLIRILTGTKNKTFITKDTPILECYYGLDVSKKLHSNYEGVFITEYEKNLISGYFTARIYPCTEKDAENLIQRLENIDKKQLEIDEQNYKIEQERIEKEKIKQKLLKKQRKKELEKQAKQELENVNLLDQSILNSERDSDVKDKAISALMMLGFQKSVSDKIVTKLVNENPTLAVEQIVKQALKLL